MTTGDLLILEVFVLALHHVVLLLKFQVVPPAACSQGLNVCFFSPQQRLITHTSHNVQPKPTITQCLCRGQGAGKESQLTFEGLSALWYFIHLVCCNDVFKYYSLIRVSQFYSRTIILILPTISYARAEIKVIIFIRSK